MSAIDTSERSMWEEHEASREKRRHFWASNDEMIARYHGYYYDDKAKGRTKEPANPGFEMLATMQSHLIAGTPQCMMTAARSDLADTELRAAALQFALNKLAVDMRLKQTLRKVLVDWFFHGGFVVVQNRRETWADPGPLDGPPRRPSAKRASPKLVEYDARATEWEDRAWDSYGQITSVRKCLDDAKKNKGSGWRVDLLNRLQVDTDEVRKMIPREGERLNRDDFMLRCVWVPDEQLDDDLGPAQGFWGTMHYFAHTSLKKSGGKDAPVPFVEIKDPEPAYCGRGGPLIRFGQYYVPDRVEPLSVMIAIEHIARSLSMREQVIERAIKSYKRIIVNGTSDPALGRKAMSLPDLHMLHAKGFDKTKMMEYVMGGLTPDILAAKDYYDNALQQRSGIGLASQGRARPGVTATADTLAAGGQQARQDDLRDSFYDSVTDVWRALAEVADSDDQFYVPLPPSALAQLQKIAPNVPPALFNKGVRGGREEGQSFEDYDIKAAPMSMRYKSELEVRMDADADLLAWSQVGPLSITTPHLDWPGILRDRANALGQPLLPSRFNQVVAEQLAMIAIQAEVAGMYTKGEQRPIPQSARNTTAKPVLPSVGGAKGPTQQAGGIGKPAAMKASTPGQKAGAKAGGVARIGSTK